jgi:phosphoglycolate phosphatase
LRLFEGLPEMLRALDVGGVDLAIVSSNSAENVQRVLGVESASRIRWYECGASLFGKASRLRKVLARSGRRAAEAIYVGDEVRDAEAAASSGIAFGAVSWGYNSAGRLVQQAPVELFRDVPELVAKLGPRR